MGLERGDGIILLRIEICRSLALTPSGEGSHWTPL